MHAPKKRLKVPNLKHVQNLELFKVKREKEFLLSIIIEINNEIYHYEE